MVLFNSFSVANDYNFGPQCSLFVTAANLEGILLATYSSLASLARGNWKLISE